MRHRKTANKQELKELQSTNKRRDWQDKNESGKTDGISLAMLNVKETLSLLTEAVEMGNNTVVLMNVALRAFLDEQKGEGSGRS